MRRNHIGSLALGLALWSVGCTTPGGGGTQRPPDLAPLPSSMTLVIARIATTSSDPTFVRQYGFDLDGVDGGPTTSCTGAPDYPSAIDDEVGIDNQFGAGAGVGLFDYAYQQHEMIDFQEAVDAQVQRGDWLVALELTGIDDAWTDPDVLVVVSRASTTHSLEHMTDGSLAPNPTLTRGAELGRVHGFIMDGELHFSLDVLSLPLGDLYPEAAIARVEIGGPIRPDGIVGAIGGAMSMSDVLTLAGTLGGATPTLDELRTIMQPDLAPSSDGSVCDSLSVGVGMRAVPAALE